MTRSHCYAEIFQQYIRAGQKHIGCRELKRYAESEHYALRLRAAENRKTPVECLEKLSIDENADVRIAVALNPKTPITLKQSLATDSDPTVRFAIAEDPHTELSLLELLAADPNPYVAHRAVKTMEILARETYPAESKPRWYQTLLSPVQSVSLAPAQ